MAGQWGLRAHDPTETSKLAKRGPYFTTQNGDPRRAMAQVSDRIGGPILRLCFIADGRAMHIHNWMRHFLRSGFEVHLISTYPCDPGNPPVASLHVVPLDFSAGLRARAGGAEAKTTH